MVILQQSCAYGRENWVSRQAQGAGVSGDTTHTPDRGVQEVFRNKMPGLERMDAVMYVAAAMDKFEGMPRPELQMIGYEIAMLGREGFDVNDSREKYQLRGLTGRFSGLHMVCLMYAVFKILKALISRSHAERGNEDPQLPVPAAVEANSTVLSLIPLRHPRPYGRSIEPPTAPVRQYSSAIGSE